MLLRLSLFLEGWSVYVLCCVSLFTSGNAFSFCAVFFGSAGARGGVGGGRRPVAAAAPSRADPARHAATAARGCRRHRRRGGGAQRQAPPWHRRRGRHGDGGTAAGRRGKRRRGGTRGRGASRAGPPLTAAAAAKTTTQMGRRGPTSPERPSRVSAIRSPPPPSLLTAAAPMTATKKARLGVGGAGPTTNAIGGGSSDRGGRATADAEAEGALAGWSDTSPPRASPGVAPAAAAGAGAAGWGATGAHSSRPRRRRRRGGGMEGGDNQWWVAVGDALGAPVMGRGKGGGGDVTLAWKTSFKTSPISLMRAKVQVPRVPHGHAGRADRRRPVVTVGLPPLPDGRQSAAAAVEVGPRHGSNRNGHCPNHCRTRSRHGHAGRACPPAGGGRLAQLPYTGRRGARVGQRAIRRCSSPWFPQV